MATRYQTRIYGELLQLVPLQDSKDSRPVEAEEASHSYRHFRRALALFGTVVVLPTLLAIILFGVVAADRYEAEARFVIRSSTRSVTSALTNLLQSTGMARATDDAYAVREYMLSRDAMVLLEEKYGLRDALARPEADFIWRFPNFYTPRGFEGLYQHYRRFVSVDYDQTTGVVTLRIEAFRAADAHRLLLGLLEAGEQLVNRLNERAHRDMLNVAMAEVDLMQQRTIAAQLRLTAFRNREAVLDPGQASMAILESIARLSVDAAETNMQLTQAQRISPQGPQLATLRGRIAAIEGQIAKERLRLTGDAKSLSAIIGEYERLMLEREFSERALMTALSSVELARVETQRQQIYLERVATPSVPDYPAFPYRVALILFVSVVSFLFYRLAFAFFSDTLRHSKA